MSAWLPLPQVFSCHQPTAFSLCLQQVRLRQTGAAIFHLPTCQANGKLCAAGELCTISPLCQGVRFPTSTTTFLRGSFIYNLSSSPQPGQAPCRFPLQHFPSCRELPQAGQALHPPPAMDAGGKASTRSTELIRGRPYKVSTRATDLR